MTLLSITKIYDLLAIKLGRDTAEHLTVYIEDKIKDTLADRSQLLATKEDLAVVKDHFTKEINRLDVRISETKSELIQWMFLFWIAQVATTFGFIFIFIKK